MQKGIPGSHVIVKSNGQTDLPDRVFEEAGALAAYYSKGRENDKVEIDSYVLRWAFRNALFTNFLLNASLCAVSFESA